MTTYELQPNNGQKSFYGKAIVIDGVLYSYGTKITDGKVRYYDSWTQTTGKHIKAFCGLNKKEFLELPLK